MVENTKGFVYRDATESISKTTILSCALDSGMRCPGNASAESILIKTTGVT